MPRRTCGAYAATAAELGRRLRARRIAQGIGMSHLARRTRMHWSYLYRVERGQTNPTLAALLTIAAALEVDLAELLHGLALRPVTDKDPDREPSPHA